MTYTSPTMILLMAAFILALMTLMLTAEFKLSWYRYSIMSKVMAGGITGFMTMGVIAISILAIGIAS